MTDLTKRLAEMMRAYMRATPPDKWDGKDASDMCANAITPAVRELIEAANAYLLVTTVDSLNCGQANQLAKALATFTEEQP